MKILRDLLAVAGKIDGIRAVISVGQQVLSLCIMIFLLFVSVIIVVSIGTAIYEVLSVYDPNTFYVK